MPAPSHLQHVAHIGGVNGSYRGNVQGAGAYHSLASMGTGSGADGMTGWHVNGNKAGMVPNMIEPPVTTATIQLPRSNSPHHHATPSWPQQHPNNTIGLTSPHTPSGSETGRSDDSEEGMDALNSLSYPMSLSGYPGQPMGQHGVDMHAHTQGHHMLHQAAPMPHTGSPATGVMYFPGGQPSNLRGSASAVPSAFATRSTPPTSASSATGGATLSSGTTGFANASNMKAPRAKRVKLEENASAAAHTVSPVAVASSHAVSSPTGIPNNNNASYPSLTSSPSSSSAADDYQHHASPSPASASSTPRVRRSAALAAKAIKDEMMDSFDTNVDDDDADVGPGAGSNRKRKRGEQQKAKHNVAEKRRRIEMNDAMDRIKACLSQGDRADDPRPTATKVSILLETADHLEALQRENERLKQQIHALSSRMQVMQTEIAHYRGESTDDTTSLVSSPGNDSHRSPRSRLAISLTSATLLTILFCLAWTPAQNMFQAYLPDSVGHVSRSLMQHAEASSYEFVFRVLHLIAENVLPTITFAISLLFTLYAYSVFIRPIISDKDLIAAHLETVTAIHSARVHGGKTAWLKAIKLSQDLGMPSPSAWMAVPHIGYECLRWVAVHLWFGVFVERAIYFIRGVTPEELDKNCELEVSLAQCLVELCPDTDWGIAATMIRALNLCAVAPNRRFVNGERVIPLYKVNLWAFGAQRLLTHFSWSYRLLAWYCTRRMTKFSKNIDAKQALFSAKDAKTTADFPASTARSQRRAPQESPETILGKTSNQKEASDSTSPSVDNNTDGETPATTESENNTPRDVSDHSNPKYVVSTQDDAALFNVMMPAPKDGSSAPSTPDVASTTSNVTVSQKETAAAKARRSIETTYRSVCLVHEIAAHMLAGRMETADTALAELIAIRQSNLPLVSRVSMDRLHAAHVIPFTRWGALRTQLMRALVQGVQGKHKEAVNLSLIVQKEADITFDVETRCASVLLSTHFLLLAGHVEAAAQQLSQLLLDPSAVSCLMSDAQQYSALRATWILLEANDTSRDRVVAGVDFVVDERFIVELKHFVNGLEVRRDHRFETLYYLLCVTEAALDAWQRLDEATTLDAIPLDDEDSPKTARKAPSAAALENAARTALVSSTNDVSAVGSMNGGNGAATPGIPTTAAERRKWSLLDGVRGSTNPNILRQHFGDALVEEEDEKMRNEGVSRAHRAMMVDQRASCFLNLKLLTRRALDLLGKAAGTGAFFLPGYHFLHAKLMILSGGQSTNVGRVEKELAASLSASWPSGRWSRSSLEESIEVLHHDLLRPLIQVDEEGNGLNDLDDEPTARTCS